MAPITIRTIPMISAPRHSLRRRSRRSDITCSFPHARVKGSVPSRGTDLPTGPYAVAGRARRAVDGTRGDAMADDGAMDRRQHDTLAAAIVAGGRRLGSRGL